MTQTMERELHSSKTVKKEYIIKDSSQKSQVNLWLDSYDNLFSDFDPRSYSQRALSDDFINETKKITSEIKAESLELIFLVPLNSKNVSIQNIIKIKLHSHFKKTLNELEKDKKSMIKKGIILAVFGTLLMLASTFISMMNNSHPIFNLLRVVFEPAGWFSAWYGFDHIFYISKEENRELEYTRKMAKAEIRFEVY